MKKYFFLLFCAYVVVNFCYTSYIYCISDKIKGQVVGEEEYRKMYKKRNGRVSYEQSVSPTVAYNYNGLDLEKSRSKWGFINLLEVGDTVTVLISDRGKRIELNTFFQFWFTLYDMMYAFGVCFVGTIILSSIFPEKKEKIREWK